MKWIKLLIIPVVLALGLGIYQLSDETANGQADKAGVKGQNADTEENNPTAAQTKMKIQSKRPNFADITDTKTKKSTFFEYMLPMIRNANTDIAAERAIVTPLLAKLVDGQNLSAAEQGKLAPLFDKYKIDIDGELSTGDVNELLRRCDIVPASLVLAQSANESAWGTSRFATKGNNFFGLWCFSKGCGLTPAQRDDGASHEVASFDTVNQGVRHYVHTINTNNAYQRLREIRADLRADNEAITGTILAEGLLRYSERGKAYVEEIQSMIRFNKLQRYTLDTTGA